jgi:hypothetical protein
MIRQARKYLVGAASSVTVISIAIVLFVVLVSAQVFRDWPIGVLGGDEKAAVASAAAVGYSPDSSPGAAKTVNPQAAGATPTTASTGAGGRPGGGDRTATPKENTSVGSSAPPVTDSESVAAPTQSSDVPSDGSDQASPSAPSDPSPSSGSQGSSSGSSAGATSPGSSSGGSSGGSTKPGAGNVVEEVVQPITGGGGSTSAKVTETVDSVDESVTDGALKETGVTGLTEEVVNGVAGPESVVGKTVDEVGNAVGGLLGGNK